MAADYWFIVAFQFVIGAIGVYAVTFEGKLAKLRHAVLGLFIIGTLLFIYTSSKCLWLRVCIARWLMRLLPQLLPGVSVAWRGVVDSRGIHDACVDHCGSTMCQARASLPCFRPFETRGIIFSTRRLYA